MTASRIAWVNYRVLAVILVVALPVSVVAGGIALGLGQSQLRDSYGEMLGRMATQTSAAVDAFVFRRIIDVTTLAKTPLVRDASETGSGVELDPDGVDATGTGVAMWDCRPMRPCCSTVRLPDFSTRW